MKKRKMLPCQKALALDCGALLNGVRSSSAMVDLTGNASAEDNFLQNCGTRISYACAEGAGWFPQYNLFDVGSGRYLLYRLKIPAGQGASATVSFREWTGVGNGGVHLYSGVFKTAWYVTKASVDLPFSGNVTGWKAVSAEEAPDMGCFTYTYSLLDPDQTEDDTELYVCMKFRDNDRMYEGRAGWNDGAWVERIVFAPFCGSIVPVTGIALEQTILTLEPGLSAGLKASVVPKNATNRNFVWTSSDPAVVRVRDSILTAVGEGDAVVTVRSEDGGLSAGCAVSVRESHEKDIVLSVGGFHDTGIQNGDPDCVLLPEVWAYSAGSGSVPTDIRKDAAGNSFRVFGARAYAIYKLRVPGGTNAILSLRPADENGALSGDQPLLNLYYTVSLPTADGDWKRADLDSDWREDASVFRFTVSDMDAADRTVYVMLYSTFVREQSARIAGLGFEAVHPEPVSFFLKAPARRTFRKGEEPDWKGMTAALRYSDGSASVLTPEEYEVVRESESGNTYPVTVRVKGADLSGQFSLFSEEDGTLPSETVLLQDRDGRKTLSLDGTWDFYKDEKAPIHVIAGCRFAKTPVALRANEIASILLALPGPETLLYPKLTVTADFSGEIAAENGEKPCLMARVNGGRWYRTNLSDFTNNPDQSTHEIDVGLCLSDLKEGSCRFEIRTNLTSGTFSILCGDGGNGTSAVIGEDGSVTPVSGDFAVELIAYPVLPFPEELKPIRVPGVWGTQLGKGADYISYHGVGWYRTSFDLPAAEARKQYVLTLDAVDYYAELWLNDCFLGSHENGYTPITVDLAEYGDLLREKENVLIVRVTDQDTAPDAEFPLKQTLAGFYHDTVGLNFAGIWNHVRLTERGVLRIADLSAAADPETMEVRLTVVLQNASPNVALDYLTVRITDPDGKTVGAAEVGEITAVPNGTVEKTVTIRVENGQRWEIASPVLYRAEAETGADRASVSFGFTSIRTREGKILFNGRPIQLNGILSWLGNWEQISPLYEDAFVRTRIRQLKEYGFNAIKFCLVVPPETLLALCDEEGIYVYIEYPVWNPTLTDGFYERAYSQMESMVKMGRNHPCLIMSDFNCEMGAYDERMARLMTWCVKTGKQIDPCRLFTDNSSCGQQLLNGVVDFWTYHPYTDVDGFAGFSKNVIRSRNLHGVLPVVFGEYADYPALADFGRLRAACGGRLPWNWKAVDEPFRADRYFAALGYSDEQIARMIEASERNCLDMKMYYVQETKKAEGLAAYFLTVIQDIGHSITGFFDELGNMKFDPAKTTFLNESTLLLDETVVNAIGGEKTVLTPAVSHYDGTDIRSGTLSYTLLAKDGTAVGSGELLTGISVENGSYQLLGETAIAMPEVKKAERFRLILTLTAQNGYRLESGWTVHVYPKTVLTAPETVGREIRFSGDDTGTGFVGRYPFARAWEDGCNPDLLVAFGSLSEAQLSYLRNGGKVLYLGSGSEAVRVEQGTYYSQYVLLFFPNNDHPLIRALDADGFGGLQFLHMKTPYVITEDREHPLTHTIISKILLRNNVPDRIQTGSYLSEFTVGEGRLLQSTLNFRGDAVLGPYLLDRMMRYLLA